MVFNPNIPRPTDLLSTSQGDLLANNAALDASFGRNHVPFSTVTNNGKHSFIEMPVSAGIPAPAPGLISGEGTIYTRSITDTLAVTSSVLYYTPDNSTNQYRLTNTSTADAAKFGNSTAYSAGLIGGWTFLPGGMIMNYGFKANPVNNDIITFARPYPTGASIFITLTAYRSNSDDKTISVEKNSITTAQFQIILSTTSTPDGVYWQVIGTG